MNTATVSTSIQALHFGHNRPEQYTLTVASGSGRKGVLSFAEVTKHGYVVPTNITALQTDRYIGLTGAQITTILRTKFLNNTGIRSIALGRGFIDQNIQDLNGLRNLQILDLKGSYVTDRGIRMLPVYARRLRQLDVSETRVSPEAVAHLKTRLPHCNIVYENSRYVAPIKRITGTTTSPGTSGNNTDANNSFDRLYSRFVESGATGVRGLQDNLIAFVDRLTRSHDDGISSAARLFQTVVIQGAQPKAPQLTAQQVRPLITTAVEGLLYRMRCELQNTVPVWERDALKIIYPTTEKPAADLTPNVYADYILSPRNTQGNKSDLCTQSLSATFRRYGDGSAAALQAKLIFIALDALSTQTLK